MSKPLVTVRELKKHFPAAHRQVVRAVDRVSIEIQRGETLVLVVQSGCG